MAVVATLSKGYDLDYIWKQVDRGPAQGRGQLLHPRPARAGESRPAAGGALARRLLVPRRGGTGRVERDGDTTVLAEYDQHARIRGGDPEQMMDAAAAAYVALTTGGTDALLMAADHALRRELSRRIRDDLIRLGIVQPGPAVTIADGAWPAPAT